MTVLSRKNLRQNRMTNAAEHAYRRLGDAINERADVKPEDEYDRGYRDAAREIKASYAHAVSLYNDSIFTDQEEK